jgi:predicted outer membrane repeat protein
MRPRIAFRLVCAGLAGCLISAAARAGGVAIVDAPGLGVLPDIQTAVNAAVSGDVLLVGPGAYAPFTIDNKSLYVFAMPGGAVTISGTIEIKNLGAAQRVILSGITATAPTATILAQPPPGLRATSNLGHVRLQSCSFTGGKGKQGTCYANGAGGHGALLTDSTRVAFVACTLVGGRGYHNTTNYSDCTGGNGGNGLEASGSAVALYDCDLRGGDGGQYGYQGGNGGHGAHQMDYGVFASGSTFTGGTGGYAADFLAAYGGDGGDGLRVEASAQAQLVDNVYIRGAHGQSFLGPPYDGEDGHPTFGAGIFNYLPQSARHFSAPSIIGELGSLAVQVSGDPGDQIFVIESATPAWLLSSPFFGIWLVPKPGQLSWAGATTLGASGSATIQRTMPSVAPPPSGRIRWMQGLAVGRGGRSISCPLHVLVLDRASQPDCDGNGSIDWLDLVEGTSGDCDGDMSSDACELALGAPDCNHNARQDSCDIASGASQDVNFDGVPDECQAMQLTLHVDDSAAPGGDGSAGAPFQDLATALATSLSGDTILVHDGTYVGPNNRSLLLNGRDIVIRSQNGSANCVIDVQGSGADVFLVENHEPPTTRLEGFTIRNARRALVVSQSGSTPPVPTIKVVDCRFEACGSSSLRAVVIAYGAARFERCAFDSNPFGAVDLSLVGPPEAEFVECSFTNNHALFGGAAYVYYSTNGVRFERCTFLGNSAVSAGGAIYTGAKGPPVLAIDNCVFAGNNAPRGGAINVSGSGFPQDAPLIIANSTFVRNTAANEGGALRINQSADVKLRNSIVWNNSSPTGPQIAIASAHGPAYVDATRCDVEGGQAAVWLGNNSNLTWGAGNFDLDPLFADADGADDDPLTLGDNDYRLLVNSPCIDAGDNALVELDVLDLDADGNTSEPVPFDLAGLPRLVDVPSAPDVGAGTPPLVDLGAYERP